MLNGARQVGKTWLLKEFGRTHYAKTAYVNFERHPELGALFEGAFDFRRILTGLQAASGVNGTPGDTLVILDEIQLCGAALTGLKYWQEEHNDYPVAAAGSLVGLALMEGTGYPVGKTNSMTLYPMSFGEFLAAIGEEGLWNVVVVPVEAKAERNLQAKSQGVYREKFSPKLSLRTSLSDPKSDTELIDVPLYAFGPSVLRLSASPRELSSATDSEVSREGAEMRRGEV